MPGSSRRALLTPGETSLCQGMSFPDVHTLARWGVAATRRTRHNDHARATDNGLCATGRVWSVPSRMRREMDHFCRAAHPAKAVATWQLDQSLAEDPSRGCSRSLAAACSMSHPTTLIPGDGADQGRSAIDQRAGDVSGPRSSVPCPARRSCSLPVGWITIAPLPTPVGTPRVGPRSRRGVDHRKGAAKAPEAPTAEAAPATAPTTSPAPDAPATPTVTPEPIAIALRPCSRCGEMAIVRYLVHEGGRPPPPTDTS